MVRVFIIGGLLLTLLAGGIALASGRPATSNAGMRGPATCSPTLITLPEAEILIYIMPDSKEVRKLGQDVTWLTDSQAVSMSVYDGTDYYIFWVTSSGPSQGSNSVGYYAVNKHTADVLLLGAGYPRMVISKELEGVERLFRRASCIGPSTIKKYRFRDPVAGGKSLTPEEVCGRAACPR